MSSDPHQSSTSASTGHSAGAAPSSPAGSAPAAASDKVTVICPTGFTKSSMVGVDPKKPLYARVTYRPA